MEITKKHLVLTFGEPGDTEVDVTIRNPKEGLTEAAVKSAMETILASGAIGEKAVIDRIIGAKYVIWQEDEVVLPA